MASFSLTQWMVVLAIVLIVLGIGRLPKTMGELARGMHAFRTGMREDAASATAGKPPVEAQPVTGSPR